jgi:aminoglycoside 2'-N-acetyltransferase I
VTAKPSNVDVRMMASDDLSDVMRSQLRAMLWQAFPDDFTEHDWEHGLGGVHVVACDGDRPVGHASVIGRTLYIGDESYLGGYLEAVAVDPAIRGRGIGVSVVQAANEVIAQQYPVAALSTHLHGFYEALGWRRWRGPTYVVAGEVWRRTEDEDAGVMVLYPPGSPVVDLTAPIAVHERSGDDW